jgi:hypothetical protein
MYFKKFITVEPFQHLNKTFYKVYISDKNIKDFYDDLDNYPEIKEFFIKTNINLMMLINCKLLDITNHNEYNFIFIDDINSLNNIQLILNDVEITNYSDINLYSYYEINSLLCITFRDPYNLITTTFYSYDWLSVKNRWAMYYDFKNNRFYTNFNYNFEIKQLTETEEILYLLQN